MARFSKVATNWLKDNSKRLDASHYSYKGFKLANAYLKNNNIKKVSLLNLVSGRNRGIFVPLRYKRIYVDNPEKGYGVVSVSTIDSSDISYSCKYISKKFVESSDNLKIKRGYILITRSGTVGKLAYLGEENDDMIGSDHIMRVVPEPSMRGGGYIYAFLRSNVGRVLITHNTFGSVVQHIEENDLYDLPIPIIEQEKMEKIHDMIEHSVDLRSEANSIIRSARERILEEAHIEKLKSTDYEFYGSHDDKRSVSVFVTNKVSSVTINAYNYSERIQRLRDRLEKAGSVLLKETLVEDKGLFSTSSFKRVELESDKSIKLLNQRDIFSIHKEGKYIARFYVPKGEEIQYGEILIAGVGTMGEAETFCRCEFAGEELVNQCVVGEVLRLKTNSDWHPGYLYAWLSTDYGFRFLRSTESGTKLCRPIPKLLLNIPVPVLNKELRNEIGEQVEHAYKLRYKAIELENEAISLIEKEIG